MKAKIGLILMVVLLGSPLVVACAKEAPPPTAEVPKGEIVFGVLDDLSGPFASAGQPWVDGIKDCVRYINEEKGGVRGHKLRHIIFDFKMEAALAISGWERMKNENAVMIASGSATIVPIILNGAQEDRIPVLSSSGAIMEQSYPKEPSYFFGTLPHLSDIYTAMIELMEEDWKQRGNAGTPRVAIDSPAFGNLGKLYYKGAKVAVEAKGWDYLMTRTPLAPADVTTQVLQMKQFDPDYVYLGITGPSAIAFLKEFERQNFHPITYAGMLIGTNDVWDAVGELAAGIPFYTRTPLWWDTDNEGVVLVRELNARWHPEVTSRGMTYFWAFFSFAAVAEAMGRAVDRVGYENLNGEAMKEALETIRDFDSMGSTVRYTWTPNDHRGIQGCLWYQFTKEGTMEKVHDWFIYGPMPEELRSDEFWLSD
jgi:branched-chain amino acid transport system substrate-binding protein